MCLVRCDCKCVVGLLSIMRIATKLRGRNLSIPSTLTLCFLSISPYMLKHMINRPGSGDV